MHHQQSLGSEDFMPAAKISMDARSDSSCMLSSAVYAARASLIEETEENKMKDRRKDEEVEGKKQSFPMKQILLMEMSWYTSPEEVAGTPSSCASDVYRLGILLFEVHT
jgi:E3 ubiquitin-protein ligase RFWD2